MHSSTSNSERTVPNVKWGRAALMMAVIVTVFFVGWESYWRTHGYAPSYNDTPGLWAAWRSELRDSDNAVVVVGDSRIRFGLDHEITSAAFDNRPVVSLAMNGSVARPVLHEVAEDENFHGTVLCSYSPNFFWMPGGPLFDMTNEWIDYEKNESISAEIGQHLMQYPDTQLAMLNQEDLTLDALLKKIPLPERQGVQLPPAYPPYFAEVLHDRREMMWERVERDPSLREHIKGVWSGFFPLMQPLPPELVEQLRSEVVADVRKIEARGGEVIFLRFPSTGEFREVERNTVPREQHWEPLIAETGSIGIHFEDHAELSQYDCPEWSHLTKADSKTYTRDLMKILDVEIAARQRAKDVRLAETTNP